MTRINVPPLELFARELAWQECDQNKYTEKARDRLPRMSCLDCGRPLTCRPGGGGLYDFDCASCSPELFVQ